MNDLFDNVWGDRSEIIVDHCVDITLPVRFLRLRLYPFPQLSTRLRSSLLVSQVVYAPQPNCYSLISSDARFRASDDVDK